MAKQKSDTVTIPKRLLGKRLWLQPPDDEGSTLRVISRRARRRGEVHTSQPERMTALQIAECRDKTAPPKLPPCSFCDSKHGETVLRLVACGNPECQACLARLAAEYTVGVGGKKSRRLELPPGY